MDDFKNALKYGWIFPHSSFTSIGLGGWTNNAALLRRCLDGLCDKLLVERTKLEAARINFDYRGFAFGNRFLAGDAAGFASGLRAKESIRLFYWVKRLQEEY